MGEMKGCPFCGGPVRFEVSRGERKREYRAYCQCCGMEFKYEEQEEEHVSYLGMATFMIAVNSRFHEAWNRRDGHV